MQSITFLRLPSVYHVLEVKLVNLEHKPQQTVNQGITALRRLNSQNSTHVPQEPSRPQLISRDLINVLLAGRANTVLKEQ